MKKTACLAVFTVIALIISYVESIIPMPLAGMKIGFANTVSLYLMVKGLRKEALLVLIARCVLSTLLFSTPITLMYSLCGGLLAIFIMSGLLKLYPEKISLIGVSVAGACMHNIGQTAVACILLRSASLILYLPVLLIAAIVTGTLIAILSNILIRRLSIFDK